MQSAPTAELGRYAAAQQAMVLLAGFLGPVLGTAIMNAWGMPALFIVSAAGRALAVATYTVPRVPVEAVPLLGSLLQRLHRVSRVFEAR